MNTKTKGLLIAIASLGGLLYGYDLGIIGTALIYLNKCMHLTEAETGVLATAVFIGSLAASVVGGGLSDFIGRKKSLIASALIFVASVAMIVLAKDFTLLLAGRILQGLSAGMIAVTVPVYMAECAPARVRGMTSTLFQFGITIGIAVAMATGWWYAQGVESASKLVTGDAAAIFKIEDHAWRMMFASSAYPTLVFILIALVVAESPRWLFKHGKKDAARRILCASRDEAQAELEMTEMEELAGRAHAHATANGDSLFQRRYLLPLILAVTLLSINQATGICAVLTFPTIMLSESGLTVADAAKAGVWMTVVNVIFTIPGVLLVDRIGRKGLLKIGTGAIILALAVGVWTYRKTETGRIDVTSTLNAVIKDNTLTIPVKLISPSEAAVTQVSVRYAIDGKEQSPVFLRSDAPNPVLEIKSDAKGGKLEILRAKFNASPSETSGRIIFVCLLVYLAGFSFGPGVCLWLMSAELMPTRVRSMGMGLGVLGNSLVTAATMLLFLPIVGNYGYSAMWGVWLVCTVAYFAFAAFILPETKGKTLEEIEAHFAKGRHDSNKGKQDSSDSDSDSDADSALDASV